MKNLKQFTAILLLLCLLAMPGCRRTADTSTTTNTETLTAEQMEERLGMPVVSVMIDLHNDENGWYSEQLRDIMNYVPGFGTEFTIYEEQLPTGGAERSNAITRLKTEIMAGKGPDLFLCEQDVYALSGNTFGNEGSDPFFTFPEKAMKNRLFLPLDDYIENAEYMEWDKFLPVVMEAGRNEEGQQIIPLSFSFVALCADKEKYGLEDWERSMSLEEMWQSNNKAIHYVTSTRTPNLVGRVMEPGADEPMFTEEELLEFIRDCGESLPGKPGYYKELNEDNTVHNGAITRTLFSPRDNFILGMGNDSPDYRIIPVRNMRGGVTANVNEFAAVNRNARHPELAFKVIDGIMSTKNQQNSKFFNSRVMVGMPVHMDIGSEGFPIEGNRYMSEANFKEYCAARDEITEVRFIGPVDEAINDIITVPAENVEKSVHEQYMLIKMLLAES